jgi:hypothetical protein
VAERENFARATAETAYRIAGIPSGVNGAYRILKNAPRLTLRLARSDSAPIVGLMRLFSTLAAVLVVGLAALALWRGGDRIEPVDSEAPASVTVPGTLGESTLEAVPESPQVASPRRAPATAPKDEVPAASAERREHSAALEQLRAHREQEERTLNQLRAETARSVHPSEEL